MGSSTLYATCAQTNPKGYITAYDKSGSQPGTTREVVINQHAGNVGWQCRPVCSVLAEAAGGSPVGSNGPSATSTVMAPRAEAPLASRLLAACAHKDTYMDQEQHIAYNMHQAR